MTTKLKLIGAADLTLLLDGWGRDDPPRESLEVYERMAASSAAPTDATTRLIAVLKNAEWLINHHNTALNYHATLRNTQKQIEALLEELE